MEALNCKDGTMTTSPADSGNGTSIQDNNKNYVRTLDIDDENCVEEEENDGNMVLYLKRGILVFWCFLAKFDADNPIKIMVLIGS